MTPPKWLVPLLALTLGLSACSDQTAPAPSVILNPGSNQNVLDFGYDAQATLSLSEGSSVSGLPAWVSVSSGPRFTFTANPFASLDDKASTPTTSAPISVTTPQARYRVNLLLRHTLIRGQVTSQTTPGASSIQSRPGRLIVQYRHAPPSGSLSTQSVGGDHYAVLEVSDMRAATHELQADPNVLQVMGDARMKAAATPLALNDQYAPEQWDLPMLGYGDVQAERPETYPNPITVAVVDSGIKAAHPDLAGQFYGKGEGAADFVTDNQNGDGTGADTDPDDPRASGASHGTQVAGLIAAKPNNSLGVAGRVLTAPIKILPVRALGVNADGNLSDIMTAIRYASGETVTVDGLVFTNPHPAKVINLSLGADQNAFDEAQKRFICAATSAATERGSVVIAASGNDGRNVTYLPAACPGVISVASVVLNPAKQWVHADYSNVSPSVTIAAPGGHPETRYNGAARNDGLLTTDWDFAHNTPVYTFTGGTSMATPQVSALAALMLAKGVTQGPADTRARLVATADPLSAPASAVGAGVINPSKALSAPLPPVPTPTPAPTAGLMVEIAAPGRILRPDVWPDGSWVAYLPSGTYTVRSGTDSDKDGQLSAGEESKTQSVSIKGGVPQTLP